VDDLQPFSTAVMVDEDLLPEQVALFGFSQGTMMALHVAPRREDPVAALVAFSGRLLEPETLADEAQCHPPVLLVHGDEDQVVPIQALPEAARALEAAGWTEVYAHVMKGTAHGIAPDGLSVGARVPARSLGYA
jgi:phospholipase/carboxylesterase